MFELWRFLRVPGDNARGSKRGKGQRWARLRRRFLLGVEQLEERVVPTLLGQALFPADNPWNQNISNAPVAANSAAIIDHIGTSTRLTPNWGADNPANGSSPLYGMPFNVVHGNSTAKVNVVIDNYPGESDIVPVPIPPGAVIEGDFQNGPNMNGGGYGENGNPNQRGDSHLLIWDEDNNIAYELYGVSRPNDPTLFPNTSDVELPKTDTLWHAAQESVWDLKTNTFRTLGATSADAAGLPILPGLARPDEGLPVSQGGQGVINHALRVTLPGGDVNPQYVYPASHMVSESLAADKVPLGARLRLASTPAINALIANMPPESQILARAMQQYGLIVADIGSAMYVSGASASVDATNQVNLTWNLDDIFASNGLEALNAGDFQVVDLTPRVTGLSASSGAAGSTITINGQNFSGAAGHLSVFFGSTAASSVSVLSDTQVSAVVPNGSGTVDVTVRSGVPETDNISSSPSANVNAPIFGYGTSAPSAADQFTFGGVTQPAPTVTGVSPGKGPATGGTAVTITGTNFTDVTGVAFAGVAAKFTVASPTRITATAPAGTAGHVADITVTTPGGTSATGAADRFTYTTAAPHITTQPKSVTVNAGQSATFTVVATGTGPLTYHWQKLIAGAWVNVSTSNTSSFTGATTATLTILSPVATDAGTYSVLVSNTGGRVRSSKVTLTVSSAPVAPVVTLNPDDQTASSGSSVTFTATASGTPVPTVQWQVSSNGAAFVNIADATSTTYSFTTTASQNGDQFRAVFTNSAGQATTSAATLTVTTGITVGAGQQFVVSAGETVTGVTVLAGGDLIVEAGGTDVGTILDGGVESVAAGGHTISPTVNNEGDMEVFGLATGPILNEGYINADAGGAVTGATLNGDIMYVAGGATVSNTTIKAGASMTLIDGGTANGTVVNGGVEWVRSGAVTNDSIVNNGGIEYVFNGGVANNLTLNSGGNATMLGAVQGATINGGGTVTVSDGGSATGSIVDNGTLAFSLSGTDTFAGDLTGSGALAVQGTGKLVVTSALNTTVSATIGVQSTLELGAAATIGVTLNYQSTLMLDQSQSFTGTIAGLSAGYQQVIDLGDVPFIQGGTTAQFVENAAHTSGTLTIADPSGSGPTVQLTLLGDYSTARFTVAAENGSSGTSVSGPF